MPTVVAAIAGVALALFSDAGSKPWALALFVFATFALVGLSQEFWRGAAARRSLKGGSMASALVGVVSRNRRRYGGYIVHIGIAVLLIGIAASSSFQTKRDVDLRPGQSAVVDGRKVTYVRADGEGGQARPHDRGDPADQQGRRSLHPAPDPALLPADRGRRGRRDQSAISPANPTAKSA